MPGQEQGRSGHYNQDPSNQTTYPKLHTCILRIIMVVSNHNHNHLFSYESAIQFQNSVLTLFKMGGGGLWQQLTF